VSKLKDHPVVRTALAVQKRYKADAADQLAAAIGFFGFLSLVPLLLLAVAAAGFVYADPADQARIALALTEALPGFDATLGDDGADTAVASLVDTVVANRGTFGLVGLVTLLVTGLKVIAAAMAATRVVFRGDVVSGVMGWVKKLGSLVVLGVTALLAVAGSSLAGFTPDAVPRPVTIMIALLISFVFDFLLFLAAYRMLSTTTSMQVRQLVPGAVLGAIGWAALKTVGATYVGGQVDSANALYGALGGVIALMLLLYLAGRLYLYGAELSAVLVEHRDGPLHPPSEDDIGDDDAGGPRHTGGSRDVDGDDDAGGPHDAGGPRRTGGSRDVADRRVGRAAVPERDGPPPIPRRARAMAVADPGPSHPATTPGTDTRRRLLAADTLVATEQAAADRGQQARTALAFGLAAAAVAAGWRFLGPGGSD
jgi:membrane protein